MPRRLFVLALLGFSLALRAQAQQSTSSRAAPLLGFDDESALRQRDMEKILLTTPQPDSAKMSLRILTEEPHVAGTPADYATALYVRDRMRSFGLTSDLVEYQVLLNYPKHVSLELVEPEQEPLSLREQPIEGDKDSADSSFFSAFHGYSADGTVTGQVVYANYGRPDDFDQLAKLGVSVKGRIVLVRYGNMFRGLKVRLAEERGAIGVLIYSDPSDDGYAKGDIYPNGPWRHPSAIQRGSVQYLSTAPGDPTTPGWASVKGAKRLARSEMKNMPRIPSLPISYGEAEKILSRLDGPNVPDGFQGALPFAYHLGPGQAKVRMEVVNDYGVRTIWDVITTVKGTEAPERWVITGNHRDAWTYGANDPNSGTATMLEVARSLGAALKTGWKPLRTIVLCSWDGEEYGLLGSTEWGEDNARTLPGKAVVYFNIDSAVGGRDFGMSGVPSLRDFLVEAAGDVADPVTGKPIRDAWETAQKAATRDRWHAEERLRKASGQSSRPNEAQIGALGSGSDYTVFLDRLGIPSTDFRFSGPNGVYHSAYDDLTWMERFTDRLFLYHGTAARYWGLILSRMADAPVVPLHYSRYGQTIEDALVDLQRKVDDYNVDQTDASKRLRLDVSTAVAAARRIHDAGLRLESSMPSSGRAEMNDALVSVEGDFLAPDGLKGRPWYRHLIYAPGYDTGYEAVIFPEPAQAVKDRSQADLDAGMKRVEAALQRAAARLEAIPQR
jgi:N-acetylated-alpha-linked acidic dipeptidase